MAQIKSIALNICILILLFGILHSLLPNKRYEKYMRLVLNLIFVVLLLRGISEIVGGQNFAFDIENYEVGQTDVCDVLEGQVVDYINEQLDSAKLSAKCLSANVEPSGETYIVSMITVEISDGEQSEILTFLQELTRLKEEQIYVADQ